MAEDKDNVIPFFHIVPVYNKRKSQELGRPWYDDKEFVQKLMPGNKTEIPDQPVKQEDIDRWPDQYRRFKDKQEQSSSGTPLEQWPYMSPSRISALKDVHIYSVEQVASLPDSAMREVGPDAQELKKKAQAYLDSAASSTLVEEVETLEERIKELEAENAELRKNQKKKPGRKSKSEAA